MPTEYIVLYRVHNQRFLIVQKFKLQLGMQEQ